MYAYPTVIVLTYYIIINLLLNGLAYYGIIIIIIAEYDSSYIVVCSIVVVTLLLLTHQKVTYPHALVITFCKCITSLSDALDQNHMFYSTKLVNELRK